MDSLALGYCLLTDSCAYGVSFLAYTQATTNS